MPSLLRKSCFRFSVRTLLVAVTVLGTLLGLVGNEATRLRMHQRAARRIHELGGRYGSLTGDGHGVSWGPSWFSIIRDRLYADSEYVWFNSTENTGLRDEDLELLKHFPHLKTLEITASLITDDALIHVQGIKSLRELTLYRTQVTGRGLKHLRGISLEKLVLGGSDITDETLGALESFPALRKLMITETSVTDVGLAHLKHVPNLEKLFLADSPICDSGMNNLLKLTRLQELDLMGLEITDDGISPLAALPHLGYLDVSHTNVTEVGLLAFRNCHTLKYLNTGSQLSSDTARNLAFSLTGCRVSNNSGFRCMQGW